MTQLDNVKIETTPTTWDKFIASFKLAFQSQSWLLGLAGLFLVWFLFDWSTDWKTLDNLKEFWSEELDPIASLATLLIALMVWYSGVTDNWHKSLPKRLTVRFEDEQGALVLLCINAHLSDVADIRTLGQQIGYQMCDKKTLDFRAPYIKQTAGEIKSNVDTGFYIHYQVTFTLTSLPPGVASNQYRVWQAPFRAEDLQVIDGKQQPFRSSNFHIH
jgi:hypothetical protein